MVSVEKTRTVGNLFDTHIGMCQKRTRRFDAFLLYKPMQWTSRCLFKNLCKRIFCHANLFGKHIARQLFPNIRLDITYDTQNAYIFVAQIPMRTFKTRKNLANKRLYEQIASEVELHRHEVGMARYPILTQ